MPKAGWLQGQTLPNPSSPADCRHHPLASPIFLATRSAKLPARYVLAAKTLCPFQWGCKQNFLKPSEARVAATGKQLDFQKGESRGSQEGSERLQGCLGSSKRGSGWFGMP